MNWADWESFKEFDLMQRPLFKRQLFKITETIATACVLEKRPQQASIILIFVALFVTMILIPQTEYHMVTERFTVHKVSESGASTDLNKLTLAELTSIDFTF